MMSIKPIGPIRRRCEPTTRGRSSLMRITAEARSPGSPAGCGRGLWDGEAYDAASVRKGGFPASLRRLSLAQR